MVNILTLQKNNNEISQKTGYDYKDYEVQVELEKLSFDEIENLALKIINDAIISIKCLSKENAPVYLIENISNIVHTIPVQLLLASEDKSKQNLDVLMFCIKSYIISINQVKSSVERLNELKHFTKWIITDDYLSAT